MPSLSSNSSTLWRSYVLGNPETDSLDFSSLDISSLKFSATDPDAQPALDSEASSALYHHQTVGGTPSEHEHYQSGRVPRVAPKRIIICCDGTWQSSVTGQKNIPSNVTRLARSIAHTGSIKKGKEKIPCRQVVFYSAGIGTSGGVNIVEKLRQAIFGDGLVAEVIKAYNFVVMNYTEGDEIFCFGFSRGAYTARSVAGLITDIGIIRRQELDDFPELYHLYRNYTHSDSFNFRQSKEYRQWVTGIRREGYDRMLHPDNKEDQWVRMPHTLPPELSRVVEVVGVFDTVGALGIPGRYHLQKVLNYVAEYAPFSGIDYQGFHNTSMSKYVKHAFHALALDEHIGPFTPTLWHLPQGDEQCPKCHETPIKKLDAHFRELIKKGSTATEEQLSHAWSHLIEAEMAVQLKDVKPNLRQVWFPGGHVNIGGGNPTILRGFPFDFDQIALISFTWMCDQIKPFLKLDNVEKLNKNFPPSVSSSLAHREIETRRRLIHGAKHKDFGSFWPLQYFWRILDQIRSYLSSVTMNFDEENDFWATGPIIDIFGILKAFLFLHIFVRVLKHIPFLSSYRTPGEYKNTKNTTKIGVDDTNEQIHPSVHYRWTQCGDYQPESLKGFLRSKKMKKQKDGKLTQLYEWKKGKVVLPEYVIKSDEHISRHLINHFGAKDFMTPLMEKEKPADLS
ncbi:peptidoglycan binding domain-containing protein [Colletotrichum incanum]|uniref:Peptidoglycan binding domain-containing protein n=1 Tax=Colletotrichum incanum TaxID=1573173 RepID=A0A162N5H0_COLIC|nr:peptidoglycan binding domain-containing protein [Colletotrichum incanum]